MLHQERKVNKCETFEFLHILRLCIALRSLFKITWICFGKILKSKKISPPSTKKPQKNQSIKTRFKKRKKIGLLTTFSFQMCVHFFRSILRAVKTNLSIVSSILSNVVLKLACTYKIPLTRRQLHIQCFTMGALWYSIHVDPWRSVGMLNWSNRNIIALVVFFIPIIGV